MKYCPAVCSPFPNLSILFQHRKAHKECPQRKLAKETLRDCIDMQPRVNETNNQVFLFHVIFYVAEKKQEQKCYRETLQPQKVYHRRVV